MFGPSISQCILESAICSQKYGNSETIILFLLGVLVGICISMISLTIQQAMFTD